MSRETVIAANRFGLGARPGDLEKLGEPRRWLKVQLDGPSRTPAEFRDLPTSAEAIVDVQSVRRMQREAKQNGDDIVEKFGRVVRRNYVEQALARYRVAASTEHPFHERLVHFWANHFAVSADKQPLPAIAGLYENEAVRPHIAGKFEDMLIAVEQHPAMIMYLDNQRSIGPNSRAGKRANRFRSDQEFGLNENLAREILELHTLGVDGGYTQDDVTTFAKVITGWSIGGANERGRFAQGEPGTFEYRDIIHEPGRHTVLGKTYADNGLKQGEAVLRDLARHPSTARHLAMKLARHFVADEPPASLVDRLAAVYLDSDGDMPKVYEALIDSDEAWLDVRSKYKSPHDYVVSTYRALDHVPENGRQVVGGLDILGQVPYRPGSPAGWPDTAEQWGGADALYKRIEFANTVSRLTAGRVNPVDLGDAVLGDSFGANTRRSIARAESQKQGMTLLLASPDFQRR